jgi:dTDP-4-dehydrorhamnose 3,5-epimerase
MKILDVHELAIPEVKAIRFARFRDHRGFFTETFRRSDFDTHPELGFLAGLEFLQANESYSLPGTVRGMHFQFNPYMGKLVRTQFGRMIDMALDIRQGSPTYGKVIALDMPTTPEAEYATWIWVPPGFAHGMFFTEASQVEYFCTGDYNPKCEVGISPLAADIDWSMCDPELKALFDATVRGSDRISPKDRDGLTLAAWTADDRAGNFVYTPGGIREI